MKNWELIRWCLIGLIGLVFVAAAIADSGMLIFGFVGGVLAVVAFVKAVRIATDELAKRA